MECAAGIVWGGSGVAGSAGSPCLSILSSARLLMCTFSAVSTAGASGSGPAPPPPPIFCNRRCRRGSMMRRRKKYAQYDPRGTAERGGGTSTTGSWFSLSRIWSRERISKIWGPGPGLNPTLLRKPTFLARFQIFRSESSDSVALYSDRASFRPVDGSFRCSSVAGPGRRVRADMRVDFVVDLDKHITTVNSRC